MTAQRSFPSFSFLWVLSALKALFAAGLMAFLPFSTMAADKFETFVDQARGQSVYFNAWGGSPAINAYIAWAADQLKVRNDITLIHVKLTDTADAVSRILAEKTAGKTSGGSVDLVWVNGENFASLKRQNLLQDEGWAFSLPSFTYTDSAALPALISDFATPTDGLESPWGRAQLVFGYDTAYVVAPPRSAAALANWVKQDENKGRFTFPRPPDFTGTSFLKQIALEVVPDSSIFAAPAPADMVSADAMLGPLWAWLADVSSHLWRAGRHYPVNYTDMVRLLGDGEVAIAMAFNPAEFSNGIAQGILPDTVRSYIHEGGTLANVHFVAIPFNANGPAAKVVANFLLSPEAQLRKANSEIWGDPTVLSMAKLPPEDAAAFAGLPRGIATLSDAQLSRSLAEPHPSWVKVIEQGWEKRYAAN